MKDQYQLIVGLEVHIQLATESKLFAADSAAYGASPNTSVSVITLAHPGILPMLNKKAVEYAIRMGLACNSEISRYCIFDRKNYFYPDLPKGFQTTQDQTPICIGGEIPINLKDGSEVVIELNRIHLEEDAGKSIHDEESEESKIDLNRAGVPLIELVTEPMIQSAEQAMALLTEIRSIVRYLEICDGNMEQGSLRCDANISVRKMTGSKLGKKVEIKNMNSIRNVGRAISFEWERQVELIESGQEIISETRLFNADSGQTFSMRAKEELNDYRYFPEPDLSPFKVSDQWLRDVKEAMPTTPRELRKKFKTEYLLSDYDTTVLTADREVARFFEETCKQSEHHKLVANWVMGPIKSLLNEQDGEIMEMPIEAGQLADLVDAIAKKKISSSVASKQVFPALINQSKSVEEVIHRLNLANSSEDDLSDVLLQVLDSISRQSEGLSKRQEKSDGHVHGRGNEADERYRRSSEIERTFKGCVGQEELEK